MAANISASAFVATRAPGHSSALRIKIDKQTESAGRSSTRIPLTLLQVNEFHETSARRQKILISCAHVPQQKIRENLKSTTWEKQAERDTRKKKTRPNNNRPSHGLENKSEN